MLQNCSVIRLLLGSSNWCRECPFVTRPSSFGRLLLGEGHGMDGVLGLSQLPNCLWPSQCVTSLESLYSMHV